MWKEEKDIDRFVTELVILMDLPSRPFVVFFPLHVLLYSLFLFLFLIVCDFNCRSKMRGNLQLVEAPRVFPYIDRWKYRGALVHRKPVHRSRPNCSRN